MTGTGTVPQFGDHVLGFRSLSLIMWTLLVVPGVTGRAVGLVGGERPGHSGRIATMAIGAGQCVAMVARVAG